MAKRVMMVLAALGCRIVHEVHVRPVRAVHVRESASHCGKQRWRLLNAGCATTGGVPLKQQRVRPMPVVIRQPSAAAQPVLKLGPALGQAPLEP